MGSVQVVLAPVALGAWLNLSFPRVMKRLSPFAPLLAASMTILISTSIVSQNAVAIRSAGPRLVLAVICLHLGERPLALHSPVDSRLIATELSSAHGMSFPRH